MKGILKLFPVALAVAALASCSDFDELASGKQFAKADGSKIYATIGESGSATRVAMARNDAGKRGLVFVEGDAINVYDLEASTKFYGYTLASGANSDQAVFDFDATASSTGVTAAPDMTSGNFYAVTKSLGAKIYSLSPGTSGPELSIEIPATFKKEDVDATWGDEPLTGKGYSMPLPLWGKVSTDGDLTKVAFNYLTGFLGINLTTLRAGTKYIAIEADKEISGYFQATLDVADPSKSVLKKHEALNSNKKIVIEINPADYEGATDFFYVPLIAQKYEKLKITAYKATEGDIADGVLFEMAAGKSFTLAAGKGITLTSGMTVMTDATDGKDLSSKIYELSQRIGNKPFTVGLIADLTTDQTVYIDKNATSTINIQMLNGKKISGNITFVEATCTGWDAATSTASWSTEVTNNLSESQTKKHTVNVIYDNTVANSGNLKFWLPNAAASIASEGLGSVPYTGYVSALTATDGGFTVDESAYINGSGLLVNYKDGPLTIDGFSSYVWQYGNGNVAINNLNDYMNEILMGTSSQPVTGNLTITGLANTTVHTGTTANKAQVRTITSYSTGTFTASKLDKQNGNGSWSFNESSEGGINIVNDGNFVTPLKNLNVTKKNNLKLENTIVNTFNYTAKKKAAVTADGKSAIVTLSGDDDDMLTINSKWDGTNNKTADIVYDGTKDALKTSVTTVLGNQIHTAFQLASLANVETDMAAGVMKSTTTINLNGTGNKQWTPIAPTVAISINGDGNAEEGQATITDLKFTPDPTKAAADFGGLFGEVAKKLTLSNIVLDGVTINHTNRVGALVAACKDVLTLENIDVKNATLDAKVNAGGVLADGSYTTSSVKMTNVAFDGGSITVDKGSILPFAGGLIGFANDITLDMVSVDADNITGGYAGGMIGGTPQNFVIKTTTAANTNTVNVTKIASNNEAGTGAAAGVIGRFCPTSATVTGSIVNTTVETALEGLLNLGGMIGTMEKGEVSFGEGTKATLCAVDATYSFNATIADANKDKAALASKWGSVNSFVGNVDAGKVKITKWCKHGDVPQTVAEKEALFFKKNVVTTTDGINTNYHYFFSGNPWVGTVGTGATIEFLDDNNQPKAATDGTDYNVRRQSPQYIDEEFSDWDD